MHRLDGRVALVTGGARGLGAAIAKALSEAGAAVMITDVLEADGAAQAERLSASGANVRFRRHDVTSEADWAAAVAACEVELGGLDILVNNAGIYLSRPLLQTSLDDFRRVQSINVDGVFLGLKAAIPVIAKRSSRWPGGGAIVNLSSVAGIVGQPGTIAYNASKGAVRLMTKSAALECAAGGLNIRVNSVHPGVIETPMYEEMMAGIAAMQPGGDNELRVRVAAAHPLGRIGAPVDIANAVLFLASDAAAFMTGSEMVVDGGLTAQ